jgi:hypothetical protein
VRSGVPSETYDSEIGVAQYALDVDAIAAAVGRVRERGS